MATPKTTTPKKKKCTVGKSFPCGYSCQAISRKCRNPLKGQAADYQSWLEAQAGKSSKDDKKAQSSNVEPPKESTKKPKSNTRTTKESTSSVAPTFKPKDYNSKAIKNLDPSDFSRFFYEDRPRLRAHENPDAIHNLSFKDAAKKGITRDADDDLATSLFGGKSKSKGLTIQGYRAAIKQSIDNGFVPSDAVIAESGLKITKSIQSQLDKNKSKLDALRARVKPIQDAIDHPLMDENDKRGYSPTLSRKDADKYVSGSFTGGTSFYHGNPTSVTDSMATEGVIPERNTNGWFGQGGYFAASKDVAQNYMTMATSQGVGSDGGLLEVKTKVKNPYVVEDMESISSHFPGEQGNLVDSIALTEYIKARGHDSIYITDLGYMVTLAKEQAVVVNRQTLKNGSPEFESAKRNIQTFDEERAVTQKSESYKVMQKAKITEKPDRFPPKSDEDEDDNLDDFLN